MLDKYEEAEAREAALVADDVATVAEARRRLAAFEKETVADLDGQRARVRLVMASLGQRGHDFLQARWPSP